MNFKSFLIMVLTAVVVAGVGLVLNYYLIFRGSIPVLTVEAPDQTLGWKTFENKGFSFKYPERFGANVWRAYFWPPKTAVSSSNNLVVLCPSLSQVSETKKREEISLKGKKFVYLKGSGVGAGSLYSNYCYITEKDSKYYSIEVQIQSHTGCYEGGCGAYCGTQYEQECREFDLERDVEPLIQKIASTISWSQ